MNAHLLSNITQSNELRLIDAAYCDEPTLIGIGPVDYIDEDAITDMTHVVDPQPSIQEALDLLLKRYLTIGRYSLHVLAGHSEIEHAVSELHTRLDDVSEGFENHPAEIVYQITSEGMDLHVACALMVLALGQEGTPS